MTSSFYLLHALSTSPYPFFFFNDTATTEIYTLSLHDALPILAGRRLQRPRVPQEPDAQRVQTDRRPAQAATRPEPEPRDRKSTRLNSSHLVISYAVFCLKKKKIEQNRQFTVRLASCLNARIHR